MRILLVARLDLPSERREEMIAYLAGLGPKFSHQITIRCGENGGGLTNTGRAQIICGMHGEQLQAIHGSPKCGAWHAGFYVFGGMTIAYSHHRGEGAGAVAVFGVGRGEAALSIWHVPVWRFADGQAPEVFPSSEARRMLDVVTFPAAAREAAEAKARDYHCRSAYYALGGASGPSGALTGAGAAWGGLPSPLKGPGIGYDPTAP